MRAMDAVRARRALIDAQIERGLRPTAYPTNDGGWALIARHPRDMGWRVFVFDPEMTPIGDYGCVAFADGHRGLLYTVAEFGGDLARPHEPTELNRRPA